MTPTIDNILAAVAEYYGVTVEEIKSGSRQQPIAMARQVAMYLVRKNYSTGYRRIGALFGRLDHSTVIYAIRRVESDYKEDVGKIEKKLTLPKIEISSGSNRWLYATPE